MHAISAASALVVEAPCNYIFELTQVRNTTDAVSAASDLSIEATCDDIFELTQMKRHTRAVSAESALVTLQQLASTPSNSQK